MAEIRIAGARLFLSGAFSFALIGAVPALYGVALPVYARSFGLGEGQAGALLTAHGAGAFAIVFAGMFGLRWLTMRLSLAALGLGMAVLALEPGWLAMLLGGCLTGAGFGLVSAIVNRRFLSEFGMRGPGMVGLVNALFGLGAIAAPILFVWAAGAPGMIFGAMALVALALIALVQPTGRGMSGAQGLPDLRQRRLGILAFVFFGVMIEVALFGFGPTALIARGVAEFTAAHLTSAFFAAFLLGRLSLYWVTRVMRAEHILLAGFAGTALAMVLAASGQATAGFVASGLFIGIMFPAFYIWGSQVLGQDPRMGSAMLAAAQGGAMAGPFMLQILLGSVGIGAFFWMLAALSAAIALALLPVMGRTRAPRA